MSLTTCSTAIVRPYGNITVMIIEELIKYNYEDRTILKFILLIRSIKRGMIKIM